MLGEVVPEVDGDVADRPAQLVQQPPHALDGTQHDEAVDHLDLGEFRGHRQLQPVDLLHRAQPGAEHQAGLGRDGRAQAGLAQPAERLGAVGAGVDRGVRPQIRLHRPSADRRGDIGTGQDDAGGQQVFHLAAGGGGADAGPFGEFCVRGAPVVREVGQHRLEGVGEGERRVAGPLRGPVVTPLVEQRRRAGREIPEPPHRALGVQPGGEPGPGGQHVFHLAEVFQQVVGHRGEVGRRDGDQDVRAARGQLHIEGRRMGGQFLGDPHPVRGMAGDLHIGQALGVAVGHAGADGDPGDAVLGEVAPPPRRGHGGDAQRRTQRRPGDAGCYLQGIDQQSLTIGESD